MSKKDWRPDDPNYNSDSTDSLDMFTRAYLEAALWSSMDDEGRPLEENYNIDDFSAEAIKEAVVDCNRFRREVGDLLDATNASDATNALDFLLTRNGHGAGFWDRGYGEIGDRLTEAAHGYGSAHPYDGGNGLLYFA